MESGKELEKISEVPEGGTPRVFDGRGEVFDVFDHAHAKSSWRATKAFNAKARSPQSVKRAEQKKGTTE